MNFCAYYAHCTAIYNTPQEQRDVETLLALGMGVLNPNCPECDHGYKAVELPSAVSRRTLSVEQTREYMREVGAR